MNGRLAIALALGAACVGYVQSIIVPVLVTGTTTATSITVSAAGLAAGAAAVGALALGAGAAVGLAAGSAGRRSRGRGRYHHGRGKREIVTSCLPFNNPEIYFSMAANSDFLDCGRRYVCELEATADDKLAQEELLIRSLFG